MVKFHDEFFSQKGKVHDQLVAVVLENIDDVTGLICPIQTPEPHIQTWLYCHKTKQRVHAKNSGGYATCATLRACRDSAGRCEYVPKLENVDNPSVTETTHQYNEYTERYTEKETEHPFYGYNRFILGYGDVILTVNDRFNAHHDGSVISSTTVPALFVIDCKPKLEDMGAVARQIKTYAAELRDERKYAEGHGSRRMWIKPEVTKVIVTCLDPPRAAKVIAANEDIKLVIYDKDTGRFSLAEPPKPNIPQATLETEVA